MFSFKQHCVILQPKNASSRKKKNELFQKVCSERSQIFCNNEALYTNLKVFQTENRMGMRSRAVSVRECAQAHVTETQLQCPGQIRVYVSHLQ